MLNEIKSPDGTVASSELKHRILREFAKTLKTKSGITEKLSTYIQDQGTVLRNVTISISTLIMFLPTWSVIQCLITITLEN